MSIKSFLLASGIAALTYSPALADTTGITDTSIKIGNTNPYSGPASAYSAIGKTITAYMKMLNRKGGITGERLSLFLLMMDIARHAQFNRHAN